MTRSPWTFVVRGYPDPPRVRFTVTCKKCGRVHRLTRPLGEPEVVWVICHDCEMPLKATLEQADIERARQPVA